MEADCTDRVATAVWARAITDTRLQGGDQPGVRAAHTQAPRRIFKVTPKAEAESLQRNFAHRGHCGTANWQWHCFRLLRARRRPDPAPRSSRLVSQR